MASQGRPDRGSKVLQFRCPDEMLAEIEQAISISFERSFGEPYTISTWIKKAIQEKIDHSKRGRKKRAV